MQVFPGIRRTTPSPSLSARLRIPTKPKTPQRRHLCFASSDGGGFGLSVSDGELESRGFRVRRTAAGLDVESLNEVFARVGFPRRDPARIRRALEHAGGAVVWVEDARSKAEGRPVAFARATGDGVFNAVVWDVVVAPSFQGMGLGRAVMERLVAELRGMGVSNIALYAEPRVVGFYRPLGFAADPDGIRGMVYSRKNQQKKRR
ncbi:serotonin N-acetyltransferase 2, chloroplastic [Phoenix dactylifera]|uniref:aralkylamine N-acetyltransferase n=1 Tax=Phoenix dactylifera TaxID=42345 RepID=A0A8B7BQ12_PHODC|nr:serotonin N-acetyltransferase 2, chloroplastic [Phoenix dactylifera]